MGWTCWTNHQSVAKISGAFKTILTHWGLQPKHFHIPSIFSGRLGWLDLHLRRPWQESQDRRDAIGFPLPHPGCGRRPAAEPAGAGAFRFDVRLQWGVANRVRGGKRWWADGVGAWCWKVGVECIFGIFLVWNGENHGKDHGKACVHFPFHILLPIL